MELLEGLKAQIEGKNIRIVLPEGTEPRILEAAARLNKEGILVPVLVGKVSEVEKVANENNFDISGIEILDPANYEEFDMMVDSFVDRRSGKATKEDAQKILLDENYFGTMLTYMGKVDGMVSGAVHSTGDTVRPALQIVKTKPGVSRTSGAFVMLKDDTRYIFSDCAINIELDAEGLAGVAVESAKTAKIFGIDPKIAMLSFSTKGSAKHDLATKVEEATKLAKEMAPELPIEGEIQFDAAIVPSVGQQKAPGSEVAGYANVFVFPSLEAGNIGYKIAQRLGGFEALGPILQGLNKPITDLSRGCSAEDVYKLSIITACQSL
ncbi:MAG: phosphate acetyltransferase [Peptostreptococcus porci]|uniref:phosphate acetyltransferase n=1 Tax=Peptostreptococcus porci TaxID=2652282 RepID=UPI002A7565D4|nr:phosphate acetyltransferase [Peptostreptococcus porci]MDY2795295.1 phosphate acetyltransferase [Peptostreptococcus porci]MDY5479489.1 phosphate acetyltransferase [Peptostreptococcus porci]MDY6232008.1 phosphate acetyltransferase [Peptostreptococcus porci]